MKLRAAKFACAVVTVLFLAGAVAPACAGQPDCSMPCCRHKARPAPAQTDAAHAKPCCSQTADPYSGAGCRYDQTRAALDPGHAAPSIAFMATASSVPHDTLDVPSARRMELLAAVSLFKTPIFLRTQTLLI